MFIICVFKDIRTETTSCCENYYNLQLGHIEKSAEEMNSKSNLLFHYIFFCLITFNKFHLLILVRTTQKAVAKKSDDIANTVTEKINSLKIHQEDLQSKLEKSPKKRVRERKKKVFLNMESHSETTNDTNELLKKLKELRMDGVKSKTVEQASSSKNISTCLSNVATSSRLGDIKKQELINNREEIQRLNKSIQRKISQSIKPKLAQIQEQLHSAKNVPTIERIHRVRSSSENPILDIIVNEPLKDTQKRKFVSESEQPISVVSKPKSTYENIRKINSKTTLSTGEEIFRYSLDELYHMQYLATMEKIPLLQKYHIMSSNVTSLDSLLLKLLVATNEDEKREIVLEAAAERKLAKRTKNGGFVFNCRKPVRYQQNSSSVESRTPAQIQLMNQFQTATQNLNLSKTQTADIQVKERSLTNDEIYKQELIHLFNDVIKDGVDKIKSTDEIVEMLLASKQASIIEGEVRVNNKNLQECYISQSKGKKDVCISKLTSRKYAFNGDVVKVLVKNSASKSSESDLKTALEDELISMNDRSFGCVLEILQKRHSRRVVGCFAAFENFKKKRKHYTFKSRDSKVPNIQVYSTELSAKWLEGTLKLEKMLFVAEVTDWLNETPVGHVVELIGEMDMLKTENVAILSQNNLDATPFTQEIIDQLPKEPYTIPAHEFTYREDLRKKCIFSIDPETARDLDDAVSCEVLPNGNLEVGVHISDVSFFIKEDSELDMLVKEKATTIYLVDNVYHMIPVPLCLLCSLLPGSDKLAYSIFWEMNEETAEVLSTRFTRSIVNSCAKLSYDHAQMFIENPTNWTEKQEDFPVIHNNFTIDNIAHVTLKLQKLALILRNNRKEKGALKIDQPKLAFSFNKDSDAPTGFFKYPMKDSNRLIEEFMLLSNISVAKFIFEKFPLISLLRNHNPPNSNGIQKLLQNFMKFGVEMDMTSSRTISESIEKIVGSAPSTGAMNAVINCLTSKTMTRAK